MRKIIFILVLILTIFCLSGCQTETQSVEKVTNNAESMFIVVEECYDWRVVYHKHTKVMYAVSYDAYNSGNFTLLVDENGNPLLWKGEEQ